MEIINKYKKLKAKFPEKSESEIHEIIKNSIIEENIKIAENSLPDYIKKKYKNNKLISILK